ncbi:exported hypothetical protein [Mesorhizobium delmotii]|uniref:Uncharacterized protein n=1 Tax=Mesorhizobium delmotii TaxID=1631247 RepID=A0A2P9AWQ8_9HYPH|nr:exported hypothetical protein [Mesorhizobium delmotii]
MVARLLIAAGVVCFALPALADGEVQKLITPADKVRLDKYDETRKAALTKPGLATPPISSSSTPCWQSRWSRFPTRT